MAYIHKIHPEATVVPTAPPPSPPPPTPPIISTSVKPDEHNIPITTSPQPQPQPRTQTLPAPPKNRHVFRYLCYTLTFLLILLVLLVSVFIAVLFLAFHPKIPNYNISTIHVTSLTLSSTASSATFAVAITARNPNKRIGIYYEPGSLLTVSFNSTDLCKGSLPVFYQGHRNTTVMQVALVGHTENSTALAAGLLAAENGGGGVPLGIRGKVPVRLKMGKLKLMKMKFKATCQLVVSSLTANNKISIKSSSCKIKLQKILGVSL